MLITNNYYYTNQYNPSFSSIVYPLEGEAAQRVGELCAQGMKQSDIAKILKVSVEKVRTTIKKFNYKKPHISQRRQNLHQMLSKGMTLEEISARTGMKMSSLNVYKHTSLYTGSTKKERAQALAKIIDKKLNHDGYSIEQIAEELHIHKTTVNNYVMAYKLRKK